MNRTCKPSQKNPNLLYLNSALGVPHLSPLLYKTKAACSEWYDWVYILNSRCGSQISSPQNHLDFYILALPPVLGQQFGNPCCYHLSSLLPPSGVPYSESSPNSKVFEGNKILIS